MNQSIFDQYEIFQKMDPLKIEVMKELATKMEGKALKDAAPVLMAASRKLRQNGQSFSPEETALLLEILTKDMTPEEKAKVEMMKTMMKKKR
ncbi:MAG: hypothetical protein J5972_07460 [Eubacterium sp.]|nr:hypothetical protein [Eubacterium sp.]